MVWPLIEFNILKPKFSVSSSTSTDVSLFQVYILVPRNGSCGHRGQKTHTLTVPHAWATGSSCLSPSYISKFPCFFSDILATFSTISFPSSFLHIITQLFKAPVCLLPIKSEFQWWQWQWWWVNSFPSLWCYVILSIFHDPHNTTTISEYYWYPFYRTGIWGSEKSSCGGCTISILQRYSHNANLENLID